MTEPAAPTVDEARAAVDACNQAHYELLAKRDEVNAQMAANAQELAAAVEQLATLEQELSAASRRQDLTGAVAPADPPPTVVELGQVTEISQAQGGE